MDRPADTSPVDPALLAEFRWRQIGPFGDEAASARWWQVATDNAFPWRACGAREDGGAVCIASRSDRGRITARDWSPAGAADASFVAIDPADADVIFTAGAAVTRADRRTGQIQDVSPPRAPGFRAAPRAPLAFSPLDPKTLFYGANALWKTTNGGQTWTGVGLEAPGITAVAPSYVDARTIWVGTDDGTIQVTRNAGASWANVTPPPRAAGMTVRTIEPSHFDPAGAYAALSDARPRLFRTRDAGATWTEIAGGLPGAAAVSTVREDPFRRGLLVAGGDAGVFVSFDDGDAWQALRLNMPSIAVRDLAVKDGDVVAATDAGGFWILDDITPLRQITPDVARAEAFLFRPGTAWRFRGGSIAAGESTGANPPDGVVISYLLGKKEDLSLFILDTATGETIRRFTGELPTAPGLHRVVWDVRYEPPPHTGGSSPPLRGMFAQPGTYQVRLTVGGRVLRQAIVVRMDPRVKTPAADLLLQHKLSKAADEMLRQLAATRATASARGDAVVVDRLDRAAAALVDVFRALQSADARPTDTAQAAVTAALERAQAAIDGR